SHSIDDRGVHHVLEVIAAPEEPSVRPYFCLHGQTYADDFLFRVGPESGDMRSGVSETRLRLQYAAEVRAAIIRRVHEQTETVVPAANGDFRERTRIRIRH